MGTMNKGKILAILLPSNWLLFMAALSLMISLNFMRNVKKLQVIFYHKEIVYRIVSLYTLILF